MENEERLLKMWELYFGTEEYTVFNKEIGLVVEIRKLLQMNEEELKNVLDTGVYNCEYSLFQQVSCPANAIRCISCAVSERVYEVFGEAVLVETRIKNHPKQSTFSEIDTSSVDSLVMLVGTCSRVGFRKIENLVTFFECLKCSKVLRVQNQGNLYKNPKCGCKSKSFMFLTGHPDSKCTDKQEIKIQEISTSESNTKTLDVDVLGGFVGTAAPGDLVRLTGIVRAALAGDAYRLKIECNNLEIIKNRSNAVSESSLETDFQTFKKISEEGELLNIFIDTLYPNVFGNNTIKAGLVLSLFGGTRKYVGTVSVRSEIHVLVIGDPGLGKSKLLLSTCSVLPKSIYVSGNSCTTAGLTVSITHDAATGEYMADAGALVVSDGGVCCIDEFDKIDDHTALFEAMEDQRVTVAKGGVCCSVPARSTIVAASNPRHGHFDAKKSIRENLKFDSFLLSRFDLVFVLVDNLSEQENFDIGQQILKKRHVGQDKLQGLVSTIRTGASQVCMATQYSKETLKKYIEHAKMSVHPVLSTAAKERIKAYFSELRKDKRVSVRNLESLIRLAESYAKMELKAVASVAHATSAISLYRKMFIKEQEKGEKKTSLESLLGEYMQNTGSRVIERGDLSALIERSGSKKTSEEVIEMLNFQGTIIKSGKSYKIMI